MFDLTAVFWRQKMETPLFREIWTPVAIRFFLSMFFSKKKEEKTEQICFPPICDVGASVRAAAFPDSAIAIVYKNGTAEGGWSVETTHLNFCHWPSTDLSKSAGTTSSRWHYFGENKCKEMVRKYEKTRQGGWKRRTRNYSYQNKR